MANYSEDEFTAKLNGLTAQTQSVNQPPAVPITGVADRGVAMDDFQSRLAALPMSQNAVNRVPGISATPNLNTSELEGRRNAAGEIIPISNEGLGAKYWRLAAQRGPEAQLEVLKKMYPDKPARILESGDITVELIDSKTGKPKDVIINPAGLDAHDLMDLAVQTPEIASSVAAAIATKGRGPLKTAAQIVLSSLAGGATGAVRDSFSRQAEGIDPNLSEIARSRGGDTALDMFLQTGALGVGKATRVLSPFARKIEPGTLEFDIQEGHKFFKNVFGENIKLTPSEVTGSPALRAVEAAETPQPGARGVMARLREKRDSAIRRIQDRAIGKLTSEESIGEESIALLRDKTVLPIENALTRAREVAQTKGQSRVTQLIDDAIGIRGGGQITRSQAGEVGVAAFESRIGQAQAKVDEAYAVVNALPGGSGNVLSGTPAARAAAEIRKELPNVSTTKEAVTFDQYGNPRSESVPTDKTLKSGVPEGLLSSLDDLESLKGGKVSLDTLTKMKRSAYDAIAAFTTAHGDVKDRWFKKIAAAYEEGIQGGIDATGDPALKSALSKARDTYKKEILPLERPGVKELAKEEMDRGKLSPEEVVNRLFEGPKAIQNYKMLKEVLGETSPALKVLKRSWVDTQIADVSDRISGSIDALALHDKFHTFSSARPELAEEMFGRNLPKIMGDLRVMAGAKNLKRLDATEVQTLMTLPNPTRGDLEMIVAMQKNRDTAYVNSILGGIADGLPIASKLKPTEFVNRITNIQTPTKDVSKVLDTIARENPELRESISTATFYRLLDDATVRDASNASKALGAGSLNISPTKLSEALGRKGSPERERYELLLGKNPLPITPGEQGPTRIEVLENLVKLMASGEVKSQAFGSSGSIAGGAAVLQATKGPIKYATNFAKKAFLAVLYTTETAKSMISNRAFTSAETAAIANTLIASEPFVRRLTETLGDETMAGEVIGELKDSIDQFVSDVADSPEARGRAELSNLARGEPAKVNIRPQGANPTP